MKVIKWFGVNVAGSMPVELWDRLAVNPHGSHAISSLTDCRGTDADAWMVTP
jgi:hypothetical protein